jgi:hypothetical protein
MINLIEDNTEMNYRIYNSEFIANNVGMIRYEGNFHYAKYRKLFKDSKRGSTWDYGVYNIFSLASGSTLFYQIYKELLFVIKDYLKDQSSLDDYSNNVWFQSWLNYHKQNEVLDWHNHFFPIHGYISIDPKDSTTEFKEYSIKNKIGNIYIGPGYREHRVVVDTPYDGNRITLAFNVATPKTIISRESEKEEHFISFIPIIIQ